MERRDAGLIFRIVRGCGHEHADVPHALALLRSCSERPEQRRHRHPAEEIDKVSSSH